MATDESTVCGVKVDPDDPVEILIRVNPSIAAVNGAKWVFKTLLALVAGNYLALAHRYAIVAGLTVFAAGLTDFAICLTAFAVGSGTGPTGGEAAAGSARGKSLAEYAGVRLL